MREIKFRAWDIDKKEMFYSDFIVYANGRIGWWVSEVGYEEMILVEKKVEIMQYTGLKDKNGKEIYEGDIVKWSDGDYKHPSNPRIAEVRFDPELCFFAFNVDGGHKFGFSNFIYTDTEKHIEVIGNIYENPELLNLTQHSMEEIKEELN